jgi:hypothetical protein
MKITIPAQVALCKIPSQPTTCKLALQDKTLPIPIYRLIDVSVMQIASTQEELAGKWTAHFSVR